MNEEYSDEAVRKYEGFTTAALADAQSTELKQEPELLPQQTEMQRMADDGGTSVLDDRSAPLPQAATTAAADEKATPLFSSVEAKEFRVRWDTIQGGFVDEPRQAVEQADNLVAGAMKRLAEVFAEERTKLEEQWDRKESVSTEDLRLALRRYRSFFGRLLSV
jgi:hypothetical protein